MPGARRKLPVGTVTFLFSDIEGSTRLVRALGPSWPDVLQQHRAILRAAFARHSGVELGTEGDSFFVAFEDAPAAVAAAAEIQRGLAARSWPAGAEVRVRIGLHTGEGRLLGNDYVGIDVHRAARIASAAYGGQVLLSDSTRALVLRDLPAHVSVRDLGEHGLKDLPQPEHLYQLVFEDLPSGFPPLPTMSGPRGNLTDPLTPFIGREREIDDVRRLVGVSRLLTVVGPGGMGKTRLVVEAATRMAVEFPDGVWFVGLAAINDPGQVPSAIAGAVGVREVGGKPPQSVLVDHLRPRHCLLILDNFEHLLGAAPMVAALLEAATGLTVVATSQAPLRVTAERVYQLPSLSTAGLAGDGTASDAVRLFIDRATRARPDFSTSVSSVAVIAEICRRLDGLPLAIELAAARVRLLSAEDILVRLDRRLDFLSGGPTDAPDRLRTLRGAIAWTHELLDPAAAVLLRRLAVFSGGVPLDAVEPVCADDASGDVLAALDELVGHSLVARQAVQPETRFRLLEVIREFALERLRDAGEEVTVRRRHAGWFRDRLEALVPAWRLDPGAGRALEPDADNIRAALGWAEDAGDVELGLRISGAGWRFWNEVGWLRDGLARTRAFLDNAGPRADPLQRMHALEAGGGLAYYLGDRASTIAAYRERLVLAQRHADPAEVADAWFDLSFGLGRAEDEAGATHALLSARHAYEELRDPVGLARCRFVESAAALAEQRIPEARAVLEEIVPVLRTHRDDNFLGPALGNLALCELLVGNMAAADRLFTEAVPLGMGRSSLAGVVIGIGAWARMRKLTGHPEEAALLAGAHEGLSATYGVPLPPLMTRLFDLAEARVGAPEELDPAVRERLVDEGRRMTIEHLRDYARAHLQAPPEHDEPNSG